MNKTAVVLISLVVLFAFLAHDMLMTVDDHGAVDNVIAQERSSLQSDLSGPSGALLSPDHDQFSAELSVVESPSSDCAVTRPATLPPTMEGIHLHCGATVPVILMHDDLAIDRVSSSFVAPGYPPDVRRALLQVYRI